MKRFKPITFILGMMIDRTKLYILNDLDLYSRSQGYKKAGACAIILFLRFLVQSFYFLHVILVNHVFFYMILFTGENLTFVLLQKNFEVFVCVQMFMNSFASHLV